MEKFEAVLAEFVANKMKSDKTWQQCQAGVVISGSSVITLFSLYDIL